MDLLKGEVYDVTEFMGSHPGGSLILNARW